MRLKPDTHRERTLPMDLTPMVDVVFLLIIFFLTTSSLIDVTRAELDLPVEEGEQEARREPGTVINITRNGTVILQQQRISFEDLAARLRAADGRADEPLDVVIRADRETDLRHVNRIAELLSDIGVRAWRLATEVPR